MKYNIKTNTSREYIYILYIQIFKLKMLDVNKLNHLLQDKVKQLQKQLKQAHLVIKLLRQQNQTLKQKLTRYENQQSTYCLHSQGSQQIFTESSQSEQEQNQSDFINIREQQCGEIQSSRNRTNKKQRNQSPELAVMTPLSNKIIEKTPPKIIFNYQSQGYHVPKVLQKQSKKQSYKQGSQSYYQKNIKKRELSVQNSAIKNQSPIVIKNMTNTLFQRIKNSNKIYDAFFVTGYSFHSMNSQVQYCFPAENRHFSVILSLIYTQNSLRPLENTQGKNQKYNPKQGGLTIKDSLVMILCKNENGQKQYLFACQIDDIIEGPDHNLYVFNRIFGFITSCNFFSAYMKIVQNFITKINNYRQEQIKTLSSLNQYTTKEQLTTLIQQHLKFLYQKNVNQNQSLTLSLGKQISIFIDVPSTMQAYKSLLQYRPWGILFSPVYFSYEQQIKQKQLFGFLLIYMLTQTKIMVYSMVKSKVSQAILHALQMIKPLQYVNPIIMATIKDQHQQYFNAPMSVILGLWGQAKQKRKQKIQIFMNKKPSFSTMSGIIQQNRMSNIDGVIFNLDTGYTFGGGISHQKNKLAIQLNYLIQNKCKSTKEQYKLIQNLIKGRIYLEMPQMREISDKIIKMINHTQLYTFYKQKNDGIFKM